MIRKVLNAIKHRIKVVAPYKKEYKAYINKKRLNKFIKYLNSQNTNISVLDIGARLGLVDYGYEELKLFNNIYLEGIEPDEKEADRIMNDKSLGNYAIVHKVGLYNKEGEIDLYMTKLKGCASIFEPASEKISDFTCSPWFEKDYTIKIKTTTLDKLYCSKKVNFDFVKIDVQGAEFEILEGGINTLSSVLGFTLEVQFSEFYKNQKLFSTIHEYMSENDYLLIMLKEESWFYDGEVVEANVAYVKNPKSIKNKEMLLKYILFSLMCENSHYVEFLLRNYGNYLEEVEKNQILELLGLSIKEPLLFLGEHN